METLLLRSLTFLVPILVFALVYYFFVKGKPRDRQKRKKADAISCVGYGLLAILLTFVPDFNWEPPLKLFMIFTGTISLSYGIYLLASR